MAVEIYANQPFTTVSSGGTTAPGQGTVESWTVTSSAEFPAASSTAAPPTQFHIVDTAAGMTTEIMAVTNVSGTTWTVTRGAESTTPVAHIAGFQVTQTVTAGAVEQARAVDWINAATMFGADPAGVNDSTAAIQDAINAVPSEGGVVYLPAGTYKVASTLTCSRSAVHIAGAARWASTINFTGTGDCLRMYQATSVSHSAYGGGVTGLTIDGTSAGAGSAGLHIGDIPQLVLDVAVSNFTGTGSIGCHFDNANYWTEQAHGDVYAYNCASGVVFDVSGATTSTGSYDRCDLRLWIDQGSAANDGVVFQNGAYLADGALAIRGNFYPSATAVTSAALRLTGSAPAGHTASNSEIINSRLDIGVECASGTYTPQTIVFGAAANQILDCYGMIDFGLAGNTFTASSNSGNFAFQGRVLGDVTLTENILASNWTVVNSGFPAGWTGLVKYKKLTDTDLVMVSFSFTIATATVVTTPLSMGVTLPAGYYYPSDAKRFFGDVSGGGLSGHQYAPGAVNSAAQFYYDGPAFTASGAAYWYGQGVFPNSA